MRKFWMVVATVATMVGLTGSAQAQEPPPTGTAADGPARSRTSTSRARTASGRRATRRSKVWFTVADGVLSDVYYPTNDNTNNETLQYVVTDGTTFTDLQTRDMTYTVQALDDRALTCRVTATAKSGRYRIVTDYLTDPDRPTVVMRSRFEALKGRPRDYKLYVRFDPTLNGNGGGGDTGQRRRRQRRGRRAGGHTLLVGSDTVTATNAANRDYAQPGVLARSTPTAASRQVSNGFAGAASDGLTQLDARAHAHRDLHGRRARQPRADRRGRPRPRRRVHARARLRRHARPRRVGAAQSTLREPLSADARCDYVARLARATTATSSSRGARTASRRTHWDDAARRVLPERQLRQGRRGQDVPAAPSPPRWPRRGARRSRPATRPTPTSAPTARCSRRDLYEAWTGAVPRRRPRARRRT